MLELCNHLLYGVADCLDGPNSLTIPLSIAFLIDFDVPSTKWVEHASPRLDHVTCCGQWNAVS